MSGIGNEKSHYIHGEWPEQWRPDTLASKNSANNLPYLYGNIELPVARYREQIVQTIADNPITIITAATGAGKTTQIGQYLFEEGYECIITQPRIVAARTVADRVRQEMVDIIGEEAEKLVGYRTAHERNDSPENKILLCTDGLQVMHELTSDGMSGDEIIILDEIHEQNANMGLLLALMKQRASDDPSFKGVIMSATIDANTLANYFTDPATGKAAPIIDVPGRTFEVEERQGGNLVEEAEKYATQQNNVLIFVPGKREIEETISALKKKLPNGHTILPLHGEQTPDQQYKVFESYEGGKVIVATSIAQTSITIADVDVVISSCWERTSDTKYGVPTLYVKPISRAGEEQQRGRVGRTKPGIYVRAQLDGYPELPPLNERDAYDKPEILRKRLDGIVLKLARAAIGIEGLEYVHSPEADAIYQAVDRLRKIGAIAIDGSITEIGEEMAYLPLDPHFARMVVASRGYSDAVRKQLIAAIAVQQDNGITLTSLDDKKRWSHLSEDSTSDIIVNLDVFIAALNMSADELERHGIIPKKFYKAREVLLTLSDREGIEETLLSTPTDEERKQLLGCIIAGADELFIHSGGGKFRDTRGMKRRIGRKSNLRKNQRDLVVGAPFNLSNMTTNGNFERLFIKGASVVEPEELANSAPERCTYETMNYFINQDGMPKVKKVMYFDGIDTGAHIIEIPEPSAELKEFIIRSLVEGAYKNSALVNSAKLQNTIKKLWDIQSRTYEDIDVDVMIDLVIEDLLYYIPNSVATTAEVDSYIPEYTIDKFLAEGVEERVLQNAPNNIEICDINVRVHYSEGNAYISLPHYLRSTLPESIPELGERKIFVRYAKEKYYHLLEDALIIAAQPSRHQRRKNANTKKSQADTASPISRKNALVRQQPASLDRNSQRPTNTQVRHVAGRR